MKLKPVLHRILVIPDNIEEADEIVRRAKAAGLAVQLDKREQAAIEIGTVHLVGTTAYKEFGTTAEIQGVVPGAKVYFAKYAGKHIKDGEQRFLMINDEDVIGVLENE